MQYLNVSIYFRPWMMEPSNNDEEAPKDPGAAKALTGMQDNEIFGEMSSLYYCAVSQCDQILRNFPTLAKNEAIQQFLKAHIL